MSDGAAPDPPAAPAADRPRPRGATVLGAFGAAVANLRQALANDGIRRLGITWTLGVAADGALVVVTLVTVFNRGGVVAAALLGAVRMVPAVIAGTGAGTLLERFRGDRILVALGLIRAASAAATAIAIFTAGHSVDDKQLTMIALFIFAAIAAAAGAPIRPTQITLMPAIARSPGELVAANTVWSTGEGFGAFLGPFVAGVLMTLGATAAVAGVAAAVFLVTAFVAARLRFEQAADASGGARVAGDGPSRPGARARLLGGVRAIRAQPVLTWSTFGVYGQVLTRGLLNAMTVVAAIELLGMGQGGTGLLAAALGLGGLAGAIFAMSVVRSERLIPTQVVGLMFWGLPLSAIGIVPLPEVALAAMVVIGVANATYDVALFTTFQRACGNEDRAPVMSVLEGAIGLGAISGSLLAPILIFIFGIRGGLVAGGLIVPAMAVAMYLRVGHVRRITVVNEELVHLLGSVPVFAELPMTAVERVAAGLVPVSAPAGTALMTQGESGDTFVVIATGEVEVIVDGRPIHRLGPGAGGGEIALLRRSPRTATVVAITDITAWSVDAGTFLAAVAGPAATAVTERMAAANLRRAEPALA